MIARVLLAVAGALLLASLFLPWFEGVSGWEHWVWADVPLAALALALLLLAARPSLWPLRIAVVVLCGLGIAVVFGHGFEPRVEVPDLSNVGVGGFVALLALLAGTVGAVAAWESRGGSVLLVAAAAGVVASLFAGWGIEAILFGPLDELARTDYPNGFERWRLLDVGLLVLAAALVAAALRPLPGAVHGLIAAAAIAAVACVGVANLERTQWMVGEGGIVEGAPLGAVGALLSLAGGVAGLAATGLSSDNTN